MVATTRLLAGSTRQTGPCGAAHPHPARPDPNRLGVARQPDDLHDPAAGGIDAGELAAAATGTAADRPDAAGIGGDRFGGDRQRRRDPGGARIDPQQLRPAVVVAQTAPAPAVTWTTGGSTVSMSGTTTVRPVTGSTRRTSPPAATQTELGVTAMASTWAVSAVLVTPGEPGGRVAVATAELVGIGEVGRGRVDGATGVAGSSRGCSHRPAASRPTRATTATKAADNQR